MVSVCPRSLAQTSCLLAVSYIPQEPSLQQGRCSHYLMGKTAGQDMCCGLLSVDVAEQGRCRGLLGPATAEPCKCASFASAAQLQGVEQGTQADAPHSHTQGGLCVWQWPR